MATGVLAVLQLQPIHIHYLLTAMDSRATLLMQIQGSQGEMPEAHHGRRLVHTEISSLPAQLQGQG